MALRIGCQGCEHLVCTSCADLKGTVGHHWCPHCCEGTSSKKRGLVETEADEMEKQEKDEEAADEEARS